MSRSWARTAKHARCPYCRATKLVTPKGVMHFHFTPAFTRCPGVGKPPLAD